MKMKVSAYDCQLAENAVAKNYKKRFPMADRIWRERFQTNKNGKWRFI